MRCGSLFLHSCVDLMLCRSFWSGLRRAVTNLVIPEDVLGSMMSKFIVKKGMRVIERSMAWGELYIYMQCVCQLYSRLISPHRRHYSRQPSNTQTAISSQQSARVRLSHLQMRLPHPHLFRSIYCLGVPHWWRQGAGRARKSPNGCRATPLGR